MRKHVSTGDKGPFLGMLMPHVPLQPVSTVAMVALAPFFFSFFSSAISC